MTIYPMEITFDGISVIVTRTGWVFRAIGDHDAYNLLPVVKRIELRKEFELQVQLAQKTPTKGDQ